MSSIWKDLHLNPRVESCFTCLRRVSSFLSTFKLLGYQPPNDVASLLFSFALDCHLESTFQYDRICQLKALPHRVQNVFWQEWDSNPRTHSRTRVLDWGFSWAWRLRSLAHSALFPSTHLFFWFVAFPLGKFFNSEMYSAKRFVSSIWKVFRSNPRIHSCCTCLCWVSSFLCTFETLGFQPRMT